MPVIEMSVFVSVGPEERRRESTVFNVLMDNS
jgi:hypothetical protein